MNVVFDVDDTITKETEFMLKYAPSFLMKKYNIQAKVVNPNGYNVDEVYGIKNILASKGVKKEDLDKETKKIVDSFWNKYFLKYMFYPLRSDIKDITKELKEMGYNINFVSLRGKKTIDKLNPIEKIVRLGIVPFLTKMQLVMNGIKHDKLYLVESNEDKLRIADDLNAKIIFDDNVSLLENVKHSVPVCIETPHNVNHEFENKNVRKCLLDIDEILDIADECKKNNKSTIKSDRFKNLKLYQKVYTETVYKLCRNVSKKQVIKMFKPFVIGEENLPIIGGPNVFVGNHRNIKDPVITISLLENPTHFAALKRMFEYNENIFGPVGKNLGTYFTTWFVKSIGALPIARPNEENYMTINFQTFKYIEDYLNLNSSVAIYPEGTLNRHPEENGDILPLKSNHAFKIAENGKAIIRPVAIVWVPKEVDIENRVLITFLPPIYTNGMKANEIAEKWEKDMHEAITSMNSILDELIKMHNNGDNVKVKHHIK